jgi:6-pyruvoyltetrahydropterin/6-carboxytetrahydropterin synthase
MRIYKKFSFEAAHFLPTAPKGHPNSRIHGHSFEVEVAIDGTPAPDSGLIMHFGELEKVIEKVRQQLDHHFLNEVDGLEHPTLENITLWIWQKLAPGLKGLAQIEVKRPTCREGCIYSGPEN